jgi:hypothetical protein
MMMTRKAPADPASALGVAQPAFCSRRRRLRVLHLREYTSVKSMRDLSCRVVLPSDVEPHTFIKLSYVQAAIMPALLPALPSRPLLFAAVSAYWTSRTILWSERGGHPESGNDPLRASLHYCVLLVSFHPLLDRHPTSAVCHDSSSCSGVVPCIDHAGTSTVVLMLIPVAYLLSVTGPKLADPPASRSLSENSTPPYAACQVRMYDWANSVPALNWLEQLPYVPQSRIYTCRLSCLLVSLPC